VLLQRVRVLYRQLPKTDTAKFHLGGDADDLSVLLSLDTDFAIQIVTNR
jgi:hypothetical protein